MLLLMRDIKERVSYDAPPPSFFFFYFHFDAMLRVFHARCCRYFTSFSPSLFADCRHYADILLRYDDFLLFHALLITC